MSFNHDDLWSALNRLADLSGKSSSWGQLQTQCIHACDEITRLRAELAEAGAVAEQWWHAGGWASGHGDTLADILREMRSQHCDEREGLRGSLEMFATMGRPETDAQWSTVETMQRHALAILATREASGGLPEAQESDAGGNKKPGS